MLGTLDFGIRLRPTARGRSATYRELVVDNFAGGGGASMGIEGALGRAVDLAINHSPDAIAVHEVNHPATRHFCEDVFQVDPLTICKGQPVGLAWFSPDCKHFSRAKGGKPVSNRVRGLAWVVIKWAKAVRPRVIILENVREFETWGPLTKDQMPCPLRKGKTFQRWLSSLRQCGYHVEWKVLNAADYGVPTNRRRLFLVARNDGEPIVWPTPTHGPGRKPYRTAAECIDLSIPCPSIFDRKKPLADKTLRRIAHGIKRYVLDNPKPFVVQVNHGGEDCRISDIEKPMGTVTGSHGQALVVPLLATTSHTGTTGRGRYVDPLTDPLKTITSGNDKAVLVPSLVHFRGDCNGRPIDEPMPTVTSGAGSTRPAGAAHALGLLTPTLIQTGYGEREGQAPRCPSLDKPLGTVVSGVKHAVVCPTLINTANGKFDSAPSRSFAAEGPLPTVTGTQKYALCAAFLTKYFGTGIGQQVESPLSTITSRDRFGVVTVEIDGQTYAIADIGMRMLSPRELARAQGFPDDYVLEGPKSRQVAAIGNSVCPKMAEVMVRANYKPMRSDKL